MQCRSSRLPCPAGPNKMSDPRWLTAPHRIKSSGNNSSGNHYCSFDYGPRAPNDNCFHYSNEDGSWFFSNPDGSTYFNNGQGYEEFNPAPEENMVDYHNHLQQQQQMARAQSVVQHHNFIQQQQPPVTVFPVKAEAYEVVVPIKPEPQGAMYHIPMHQIPVYNGGYGAPPNNAHNVHGYPVYSPAQYNVPQPRLR